MLAPFCAVHDILQSPDALRDVIRQLRPAARVAMRPIPQTASRGPAGMAVLADGGSAMMKGYVFECDVTA